MQEGDQCWCTFVGEDCGCVCGLESKVGGLAATPRLERHVADRYIHLYKYGQSMGTVLYMYVTATLRQKNNNSRQTHALPHILHGIFRDLPGFLPGLRRCARGIEFLLPRRGAGELDDGWL